MTPFERALRDRIAAAGPITLEAYMEACNAFYYATRDPLGARGDFTTAPEINQMFGELVGSALADCWRRAGSPTEAIYVELGPGRGTLAADALRVMRGAGFPGAAHLVETSPVLRDAQAEAVPGAQWHDGLGSLPEAPTLIVANEFFDALPIRQRAGGVERKVMVAAGGLAFDRDGEIVEDSPVREEVARVLGERLAKFGGAAIVIDYGHARSAPGETLQAVRGHGFAPILADPGEQDLTAHVDFEALDIAARNVGARTTVVIAQGDWLRALGIEARADALVRANPDRADEIAAALDRLTGEEEMGQLFKVMAIHAHDWPAPAGFA
ncbi:MAG: SAM-dependent methyltransferase [Sphingomicrobium sp.]